ncbi:MAG: FecR family protein [Candidatus Wallbacteria bacterium]
MINCKSIKNLIIECGGDLKKLTIAKSEVDALAAHINNCPECSKVMSRLSALEKLVAEDKIPAVPPAIASKIMARIAAEQNKCVQKKVLAVTNAEEMTLIEKMAALFLPKENRVWAYSIVIIIMAAALFLTLTHENNIPKENVIVKAGDKNPPETIDNKFKNNQPISNQNQNIAILENKAGTISNDDKKFKKCGFIVENGKLAAAGSDDEYLSNPAADLKVNYNGLATVIINRDSKFKFRDSGIDLAAGSLNIDIFVKNVIKFSVSTPESLVEVTGTKFSVSRKNNITEVSVQQGSVKVTNKITGTSEILKHGDKKIINKILKFQEKSNEAQTSEAAIKNSIPLQTAGVELSTRKTDEATLKTDTKEIRNDTKVNNLIDKLKTNNMHEGN